MIAKRAPGQRLLNLAAKADFIALIDKNLAACEYSDRSQFIREAMREKIMRTLGIEFPIELTRPPGRIGKGGRRPGQLNAAKPMKYPALDTAGHSLNESIASAKVKAAADKATEAAKQARLAKPKG